MSGLDPRILLRGYAAGIFPMADSRDADDIFWVEPRSRAILPLRRFRLSRSLARRVRSDHFTVTCDTAFADVVARLRRPARNLDQRRDRTRHARPPRRGAGAFDRVLAGRRRSRELVGGLYGVRWAAPSSANRCSAAAPMRRRSRWRGSSRASASAFPAARLPVHDRSPRLARRGDRQARRFTSRCSPARSARARARARQGRRPAPGSNCSANRRRDALPPPDFGALDRLLDPAVRSRRFRRAGPAHRAALDPDVIDRMLDDVERRAFLVQPARKDPLPVAIGPAHVELDEGAGQPLGFPRRGGVAGAKPDQRVLGADRLARLEREIADDAVALVEQARAPRRARPSASRPAVSTDGGRVSAVTLLLPRQSSSGLGSQAATASADAIRPRKRSALHAWSGVHAL